MRGGGGDEEAGEIREREEVATDEFKVVGDCRQVPLDLLRFNRTIYEIFSQ